jgi:hypothetical protein
MGLKVCARGIGSLRFRIASGKEHRQTTREINPHRAQAVANMLTIDVVRERQVKAPD